MRENWCIILENKYFIHSHLFRFPFWEQVFDVCSPLAAEFKAPFRDGKVQMEGASLSYVRNAANARKSLSFWLYPALYP